MCPKKLMRVTIPKTCSKCKNCFLEERIKKIKQKTIQIWDYDGDAVLFNKHKNKISSLVELNESGLLKNISSWLFEKGGRPEQFSEIILDFLQK